MIKKPIIGSVVFAFFIFTVPSFVMAEDATDRVKAVLDKIFSIISNETLQAPEMKDRKERAIMDAIDVAFDWEEFSSRSLGKNWRKITDSEKREFISLFKELIKRTYMEKSGQYSGGTFEILGQDMDEKYGEVKSQFISSNGTRTQVDYKVMKKDGEWWVYDIYIKGSSLVGTYRKQFNSILLRSSFDELMEILREKIEKGT